MSSKNVFYIIKPCPLCGSMPKIEPSNPKIEGTAWTRIICYCNENAIVKVEVFQDREHKQKAIKIWNNRPTE